MLTLPSVFPSTGRRGGLRRNGVQRRDIAIQQRTEFIGVIDAVRNEVVENGVRRLNPLPRRQGTADVRAGHENILRGNRGRARRLHAVSCTRENVCVGHNRERATAVVVQLLQLLHAPSSESSAARFQRPTGFAAYCHAAGHIVQRAERAALQLMNQQAGILTRQGEREALLRIGKRRGERENAFHDVGLDEPVDWLSARLVIDRLREFTRPVTANQNNFHVCRRERVRDAGENFRGRSEVQHKHRVLWVEMHGQHHFRTELAGHHRMHERNPVGDFVFARGFHEAGVQLLDDVQRGAVQVETFVGNQLKQARTGGVDHRSRPLVVGHLQRDAAAQVQQAVKNESRCRDRRCVAGSHLHRHENFLKRPGAVNRNANGLLRKAGSGQRQPTVLNEGEFLSENHRKKKEGGVGLNAGPGLADGVLDGGISFADDAGLSLNPIDGEDSAEDTGDEDCSLENFGFHGVCDSFVFNCRTPCPLPQLRNSGG